MAFLLLHFLHMPISLKTFRAFQCRRIGTRSYLVADYSIECGSPKHQLFVALAIIWSLIFVIGFALGFHLLLSYKQEFEYPWDAALKTLVMMSGEFDYGDIFFADDGKVPFEAVTYSMFVVFFFLLSIVTLNLLVGLTVDNIKEFLDNAEIQNLKLRVSLIR